MGKGYQVGDLCGYDHLLQECTLNLHSWGNLFYFIISFFLLIYSDTNLYEQVFLHDYKSLFIFFTNKVFPTLIHLHIILEYL